MHSSRMHTAHSLTVSHCILCTPPSTTHPLPAMHALQQPCTPPHNHTHPQQPCTLRGNHTCPPATMHVPHNHACPLVTTHAPHNHAHPLATKHALPLATMPPSNHISPTTTHAPQQPQCLQQHACPPTTMHTPQQPCTPPSNHAHPLATIHTPSNHTCPPATTHTPCEQNHRKSTKFDLNINLPIEPFTAKKFEMHP